MPGLGYLDSESDPCRRGYFVQTQSGPDSLTCDVHPKVGSTGRLLAKGVAPAASRFGIEYLSLAP
jgi:hypothetical protein